MTRILLAAALLAHAGVAGAHVDQPSPSAAPWTNWPFAPDVLLGTALAAGFYIAGILRRPGRTAAESWRRHTSFLGGLMAVLVAVQSPLDSLAQHSFAMHQVQHLLLYALGPLLIMLAGPQALLISGMPVFLQRRLVAPLMRSRVVRAFFSFLAQPAVATLFFVGSLWFWQLPRLHDLTLLDQPLHYLMHMSMLFTGLVFFWRVLDPRPSPQGAGYGTRIVMVTAAIAGTLPLGAYLALKSQVLYPAYDWFGRIWGLSALTDETQGGLIIWLPGGAICAVAILIVLRMWGGREARSDERRRRGLPGGERQDGDSTRSRNRSLAAKLFAFAAVAFAGLIAVVSIGLAVLS